MTTMQKAYKGPAMEGFIANWYARITKRDRYSPLADAIAARLAPGARVLEVAPGRRASRLRRHNRILWREVSDIFVPRGPEMSHTSFRR